MAMDSAAFATTPDAGCRYFWQVIEHELTQRFLRITRANAGEMGSETQLESAR
jgi:hypothetical protein